MGEDTPNVWSFVEEHYENYHSCNEIAENDDLYKIVHGEEIEKDSAADRLLQDFYKQAGTERDVILLAEQALHESNSYIFKRAIEGFLNKQQK